MDTACWLYEHLPINGATLTGVYHPSIPRLVSNNPLLGQAPQLTAKDGLGLTRTLQALADLASTHRRGMSYCNMVTTPTILLTRPEEISQILLHNRDKVDRGQMIPVFGHIFGQETILSSASNQTWKQKRSNLLQWVLKPDALQQAALPIQKIIDEYIDVLKANNEVPSLQNFMVNLTMDVIAQIALGSKRLGAHSTKLSHAFDEAMDVASNPMSELRERIAISKLGACLEYFYIKTNANIERQKVDLQNILFAHFLQPNIDAHGQCLFRERPNVFQRYFKEQPDNVLAFRNVIEDLGLLLLAGHETTANLLQFCFLILAFNPEITQRIREEIATHQPSDRPWTRGDLKNMDYLGKFIKETLRLFPPFPIIPREVTEDIIVADIPYCKNADEYTLAMSKRDSSKDILLQKGTAIIISPLVTQRLESLYSNPASFDPKRFLTGIESFGLKPGTTEAGLKEFLIPFGIGERECIGKLFALQEAMLTIIKILSTFDIEASIINNAAPPTKLPQVYIRNTLKTLDEYAVKFVPRANHEQPLVMKT